MRLSSEDIWKMIAMFVLGLLLGPIAHSFMEVIVKWLGGNGR